MANAEETRCMLNLFNEEFNTSKQEQIQRFLKDQQELNRRFEDYALKSDDDSDDSSATAHNLQRKKYSSGISPEELHKNLHEQCEKEDDRDSLDSVLTACAYSESDEEDRRCSAASVRPVCHKLLSHNGTERKTSRLGRSQSLRVANKVDLNALRHAPQPPNSPDIGDSEGKPSLDDLKFSRRASLRESRENKRKQPKKLLAKRSERPKSALGYRTALTLVSEEAYEEENGFLPPERPQWDGGKTRAAPNAEDSRSAPVYKNRVLNWDTDCPKAVDAPAIQDQIPDLSTPLDSSRSRGPVYAPASMLSRPHPPPDGRGGGTSFTRNNAVRQSMPVQKRHSESNMPLNTPPSVKDNPLKPFNRLSTFSIPIHADDEPIVNNEPQTGRMRRFKGHGNLAGPELTPRGTHIAMLKLPPVAHKPTKKKTYPKTDTPVRPGTSFSFFNSSQTVV